ncbi:phage major capsid protein [Aeromonas salmonicida]|uniref:phage major capsid protein n=1 Tax=Aeromonas salmonicida TaxID=645 RepID=UPI003D248846
MEQNEMLEQIQVQLKSVVETKQAAVEELAEVKSQLEALSSLNTKSTDELAQLQTKYNEQITHLTTRIEEQELALAKGQNIMTQETRIVKSADVLAAVKSALPVMHTQKLSLKAALATTDADQAPLFIEGWEAEILKRLTDFSPIAKAIGITRIDTMRNASKRVRVSTAGCRLAVENSADGAIAATGTGKHEWLRAAEGKIEAMPIVTREALRDGDVNVTDILEELQESFGVTQCAWALRGNENDLDGILAKFGNEEGDAVRAFNYFQALALPRTFGTELKATIEFLQKLKRSLKMAYRAGAYWYMNEETYDMLAGLVDANGRPLIQDLLTEGYDGRMLGYPVVIDPTMPGITDGNDIAIMFGDLARAFKIYQVGEFYTNFEEGARTGGNTALYHSMSVAERMNDSFAVKGARVPMPKPAK